MDFPFVPVNGFTPNDPGWNGVGKIDNWPVDTSGLRYTFVVGQRSLSIEVLGPTAFRLRFNPAENPDYSYETQTAVVTRDLGLAGLRVTHSQPDAGVPVIQIGSIAINVGLQPVAVQVYRGSQLIHQDAPGQGVLYIPGQEVAVVMKTAAPGAGYLGLGEKAGAQLLKNGFTFTFLNSTTSSTTAPRWARPVPSTQPSPSTARSPCSSRATRFPPARSPAHPTPAATAFLTSCASTPPGPAVRPCRRVTSSVSTRGPTAISIATSSPPRGPWRMAGKRGARTRAWFPFRGKGRLAWASVLVVVFIVDSPPRHGLGVGDDGTIDLDAVART